MPNIDAITIERLPDETPKAYQARVEYVTAGPQRSLDKLRQHYGRTAAYTRQLEQWSSRYDWVECARKFDEQIAFLTTQEAADAYRRDLEDHRKRYGDAGKALYQVAGAVLQRLGKALAQPPTVIEGKDGRTYEIPGVRVTPELLTTAARAMTIAADLEAHALRLGDILPRLDHDVLDRE